MTLQPGLLLLFFISFLLAGCSKNETPSSRQSAPLAQIDPANTATISGVISFQGTPPKPQPIDMSADPACVMGKTPASFGEAYAVTNGHLQNVYVYIKDGLGNYRYPPQLPEIVNQKGCRYIPHVLGIMAGQELQVLNSDPALHNIHAMPQDNAGWNVSQYPGGDAVEKTFDKPELMIPIQCNNHPWMKMYVNVSPHPFFTVTVAEGKYAISGLPPGTYTLAAVHEKMGEKTMKITVAPKSQNSADFQFSDRDVK